MLLAALAFVPYVATPAIVQAQDLNLSPFPIADGLSVSRGRIDPSRSEAMALSPEDTCTLVREAWGWPNCQGIDGFIIDTTSSTDSMMIYAPDSNGYVTFDDWTDEGVTELMAAIEADLRLGAEGQSASLGYPVLFKGWRVPPTLDRERAIMYYATDWQFDQDRTINVSVTQFDRSGFIEFNLIPIDSNMSEEKMRGLIIDNLALYQPVAEQSYASFVTGDKVAAVGALGLLGTFFGVKYGKAAGGFLVALLAFGKKFLIFGIMGVVALGGMFKRMLLRPKRDPDV